MATETLATAVQRISRLIPVRSTNVTGEGVYVCTPSASVPDSLRQAHVERNYTYMVTGSRTTPEHGPAYYVTSYGVLIAWVTLDGQTHYADDVVNDGHKTTRLRHRDAIRAVWPARFPLDRDGAPAVGVHA